MKLVLERKKYWENGKKMGKWKKWESTLTEDFKMWLRGTPGDVWEIIKFDNSF